MDIKARRTLLAVMMAWSATGMIIAQIQLDHLQEINPFWTQGVFESIDKSMLPATTSDIAYHLLFVEMYLRSHAPAGLTQDQLNNRIAGLNMLHGYAIQACFPKNHHHSERTPYFIDDDGTACAVGHLMVETGYEGLAYQICKENNYLFLKDLASEYGGISAWANQYGFCQEELEWIQPTYDLCSEPCCEYGEIQHVSIYGWCDGCFMPAPPEPYYAYLATFIAIYAFNRLDAQGNVIGSAHPCGLAAGFYSMDVEWGFYDTIFFVQYTFQITQPEFLAVTSELVHDDGTCNGSIILSISGGVTPYQIDWNNGATGEALHDICGGTYAVTVTDASGANQKRTFEVQNLTTVIGIDTELKFETYPNPVVESLLISNPTPEIAQMHLYDMQGSKVGSETLQPGLNRIRMHEYNPGGYFIEIKHGEDIVTRKIIKL